MRRFSLTKHVEDALGGNPTLSKILVGLFGTMLTMLTIMAAGQYWLYQQQRADINFRLQNQDAEIGFLKNRQDMMFTRQQGLESDRKEMDVRIAKEYVSLERYMCDVKDLKETMRDGFKNIEHRIIALHTAQPGNSKK